MIEFQEIPSYLPHVRFSRDFSFSRHTTVGIGGTAPVALYPKNEKELTDTVNFLLERQIPHFFLGQGANVLVSDEGFQGAVVCTIGMKKISRMSECRVYAECGATAEQLVRFTAENALTGAEFLAGIPASVGGLAFMNAGADNTYVQSVIETVRVVRSGVLTDVPVYECGYSYKKSVFQTNGDCIAGCVYRFRAGNVTEIAAKVRARRFARSKLPKGRSVGCVFLNPPQGPAGELIERAGWKGFSIGGALVSPEHANFIINTGNATAKDFRELVGRIRRDIYTKTGIKLQEEFRYIGE